ncbi:MAG: type I glutamate--ammonia ligase [Alphaproteobacteria bacterium 16-39-46]|nr:MAG: type I glutamate--ammonia ligase [Alphaproteobacteria bacterium 16-39-46]OZA43072.1 MAG: type I glutamate--ammonia ligase [Alphaproteobacteria bacterium 17-39-52]HQS84114.1 type I glutamate--ammonia ligase [Alphaproteobacteria bacterium]HQS93988.1 type I glutamate--ammonia ligase [Alphaproteobacteria bacterium]
MTAPIQTALKFIKDSDAAYVGFRFTDLLGEWRQITLHVSQVSLSLFKEGLMFDGSSVPGWKLIHDSDMLLMPDPSTGFIDVFSAQPTLIFTCNVYDPITITPYDRDPRSTAQKAENYLLKSGIGTKAYFGPEPEFFIFDDIRFKVDPYNSFYAIKSQESPPSSGEDFAEGNSGYRSAQKAAYFSAPPLDGTHDLRSEILTHLLNAGIPIEKHHHEVSPAQHELGFKFSTLCQTADWIQIFKSTVRNTALSYGKTATFMPKPIFEENGSGMHVHQSIFKGEKNLFLGDGYAGLSDLALYYIGGILHHGRALNAFTNPTTNSYKRLVPGYEAPVLLGYSARNRSAACRIPHVTSPSGRRIETRFPDPAANPYLALSALLMAGLDGIEKKIHPKDALDTNLYELDSQKLETIPRLCSSLKEALQALDKDRDFLLQGNVFSNDQIDAYMRLKGEEAHVVDHTPSPLEFKMYYGC